MDLRLEDMGMGAVSEKFEEELAKVVMNIMDPNTDHKVMRKISIDVKVKPNPENRELCDMEVIVQSKLAPSKTLVSMLHVGVSTTGEVNAIESIPTQGKLFDEDGSDGKKLHQIHG